MEKSELIEKNTKNTDDLHRRFEVQRDLMASILEKNVDDDL